MPGPAEPIRIVTTNDSSITVEPPAAVEDPSVGCHSGCGGPGQGHCIGGVCFCALGYTGLDCSTKVSSEGSVEEAAGRAMNMPEAPRRGASPRKHDSSDGNHGGGHVLSAPSFLETAQHSKTAAQHGLFGYESFAMESDADTWMREHFSKEEEGEGETEEAEDEEEAGEEEEGEPEVVQPEVVQPEVVQPEVIEMMTNHTERGSRPGLVAGAATLQIEAAPAAMMTPLVLLQTGSDVMAASAAGRAAGPAA